MDSESDGLKRELSAPMLAIYGAGTILGAGIYVLIGEIAGKAGFWTPLAFVVAVIAAGVNGVVYAELSTRTPHAGGPSDYVEKAFSSRWFTVVIGWMIVATGLVSAATITTGFTGYLGSFFTIPSWIPPVAMPLLIGAVAAAGARESGWFMAITTTAGVLGLLFVMYVGFFGPDEVGRTWSEYGSELPSLGDFGVISSIFTGAFLAVYAFIGFEDIVHMAEEVEEPARSVPFAIVVAISVAFVLYVLVAIAALLTVDPGMLAESKAPLLVVVEEAGYPKWPLGVLSLWIIINGALAQVIMATRVVYSMKDQGGAPDWLGRVNEKTGTPLIATAGATAVVIVLASFFPTGALAAATSFIMLMVFAASNAALIILERREEDARFDAPVFVPYVGFVLCILLMLGELFL